MKMKEKEAEKGNERIVKRNNRVFELEREQRMEM